MLFVSGIIVMDTQAIDVSTTSLTMLINSELWLKIKRVDIALRSERQVTKRNAVISVHVLYVENHTIQTCMQGKTF